MLAALAVSFGVSAGQNLLSGMAQRDQLKAQNEAQKRQNRQNAVEAARSIASTKIQQAAVRQQAAQDLSTAQRMAMTALGGSTAQAAAAGVRGASVDAMATDIDIELGRARGEIEQAAVTQEYNLNQRIRDIAVQTRLNFGQLSKVPSYRSMALQAVAGGAMSAGSQYAKSYFKFGGTAVNDGRDPQ